MEPLEKELRRVAVSAAIDGAGQQRSRREEITGVVGGHAFLYERLDFALAFGHEPARAIDIRLGAAVSAIEKRHPGPDVDRLLVAAGKILIEASQEQPL